MNEQQSKRFGWGAEEPSLLITCFGIGMLLCGGFIVSYAPVVGVIPYVLIPFGLGILATLVGLGLLNTNLKYIDY